MGFMIIFAYNSAHNLHKTNLTAQKKKKLYKIFCDSSYSWDINDSRNISYITELITITEMQK